MDLRHSTNDAIGSYAREPHTTTVCMRINRDDERIRNARSGTIHQKVTIGQTPHSEIMRKNIVSLVIIFPRRMSKNAG